MANSAITYCWAKANSEIETLVVLDYHSNVDKNQDVKTSSYIRYCTYSRVPVIITEYSTKKTLLLFYAQYQCTLPYLTVDLWYI